MDEVGFLPNQSMYCTSKLRGDEELPETSSNLSLANLALENQANYSCAALNSLGVSDFETIELMVASKENFSNI